MTRENKRFIVMLYVYEYYKLNEYHKFDKLDKVNFIGQMNYYTKYLIMIFDHISEVNVQLKF